MDSNSSISSFIVIGWMRSSWRWKTFGDLGEVKASHSRGGHPGCGSAFAGVPLSGSQSPSRQHLPVTFAPFMPPFKPWFSCPVHSKMTAKLPPPFNSGAAQCGDKRWGTQAFLLSRRVILENFLSLVLNFLVCKMGRKQPYLLQGVASRC